MARQRGSLLRRATGGPPLHVFEPIKRTRLAPTDLSVRIAYGCAHLAGWDDPARTAVRLQRSEASTRESRPRVFG